MLDNPIVISYSPFGCVLDILKKDGHTWVNEDLEKALLDRYPLPILNFLEQINLLMSEVSCNSYLHDISFSTIHYCKTVESKVYVLMKFNEYSTNKVNIYSLFILISKQACNSTDFSLLSLTIKKLHIHLSEEKISTISLNLLDQGKNTACTSFDYFKLSQSYSSCDKKKEASAQLDKAFNLLYQESNYRHAITLLSRLIDDCTILNGINLFPEEWEKRFEKLINKLKENEDIKENS